MFVFVSACVFKSVCMCVPVCASVCARMCVNVHARAYVFDLPLPEERRSHADSLCALTDVCSSRSQCQSPFLSILVLSLRDLVNKVGLEF